MLQRCEFSGQPLRSGSGHLVQSSTFRLLIPGTSWSLHAKLSRVERGLAIGSKRNHALECALAIAYHRLRQRVYEDIAPAPSRKIELERYQRQRFRSAVESARAEGRSCYWQIDKKTKA